MSVVFPFALPTTGNLVLSSHVRSIDYQSIVTSADGARAAVRDVLKRAKRASSPDTLAVIKAIEEYIPYLFTIIRGVDGSSEFDFVTEVTSTWRMPLRTSRAQINVIEAPKVEVMGLEFERGMVLLTYALALVVQSDKVIQTSSSEDEEQTPWKQATSYLLKAESVLSYLSSSPPAIEQQQGNNTPIDLQSTTISGLSNIVKGSLHLLILYKSFNDPVSTTSAGLLSRIAIYATEKFSSASQLLQKPQSKMKAKVPGFSDALTTWLVNAQAYTTASAYRYMALESSEKSQVGRALGLLSLANDTIGSMKNRKESEAIFSMGQRLKTDIDALQQKYKAENDRLAFQKIPDLKELKYNWPSGREATSLRPPWSPPQSLVCGYTTSNVQHSGYF
jgi:hypothetical protein